MSEVIFTTVHGSRLYGFEHESSDYDTFTVTDSRSRKAVHRIRDDQDSVTVGVWHFLDLAMSGSHQSVEALYSPVKVWADTDAARQFRPIIEATRVNAGTVAEKYERTIRKFAYGTYKQRRHAIRLARMLADMRAGKTPRVRITSEQFDVMCMVAMHANSEALLSALGLHREEAKLSD